MSLLSELRGEKVKCETALKRTLSRTENFRQCCVDALRSEVGKLRPAGRMRPERLFYAARRHLQKLNLLF